MTHAGLGIAGLRAGYGANTVLHGIDLDLTAGCVTAIVGANACGKSTLLRSIARLVVPQSGQVLLDGVSMHKMSSKNVAKRVGYLPQSAIAPEGITVLDLVSRGRHPHRKLWSRWSKEDTEAVAEALQLTGTDHLVERDVGALSGGQRQKVWIAMALAQQTDILLLDEPTTYLDINHQIEVLDLLSDLNSRRETTVVMVLHDLNFSARYADVLVAMKEGRIYASGAVDEVFSEQTIRDVFGIECLVTADPVTGKQMMIPKSSKSVQ